MTDALTRLADAVETGTATPDDFLAALRRSAFHGISAYNGSLDAAKALHEAVFPPCNQYTIDEGPSGCGAYIVCWPDGLSGENQMEYRGYAETPTRAWLLAILRALAQVQK